MSGDPILSSLRAALRGSGRMHINSRTYLDYDAFAHMGRVILKLHGELFLLKKWKT